jgi:plastocyanin
VFVNDGQQPHTATDMPGPGRSAGWNALPSGSAPWDSGVVNTAGRYTVVLTATGQYRYHGAFHASMGMVASITARRAQ